MKASAARVGKYGIVGLLGVSTQTATLLFLHWAGMSGAASNVIGWSLAAVVSYVGQSRWTFADRKRRSVSAFIGIALLTLVLSTVASWGLIDQLHFSALWLVPIISVVIPAINFTLMRLFAFRPAS